ncbi:ABC transporter permease [Romboutsia sp. Marseille-P6047]|uniref:ABC transporter permease n=1 Tax=Romboutsia sp. Marseille-P6047 TaxID=2161817 RepID=UPI000F05046D|nr:ABC transporter permease [Romboutsia sp. Marseille-P6047]
MKNSKAYKKSIIREILSSKARFASILIIILLGVAFYAGIKSSGPDINESVNEFYNSQKLMDSKIVSSLGLTEGDLNLLENNDKILDYYASHTIDANLTNKNSVVKFMEYNKDNNINDYIILDGNLPQNSGEIALDEQALKVDKSLKIGDTYVIDTDEETMNSFKQKEFKIVGIVRSPMYMEKESRGTTTIGKGTIDYFALLNSKDIEVDAYTEIYVRFKNLQNIDTYSDEYKDKMEENTKYLEALYSKRGLERVEEIKKDAQEELDKAYKEIKENESKLLSAQKEIEDGKVKLEDGKVKYDQSLKEYKNQIKEGEANISQGKSEISAAQSEIEKQKKSIEEGKLNLINAKNTLDNTKQEFLNLGIDPDQDLNDLKNNISSEMPNFETLLDGIVSYQEGKVQYETQLSVLTEGEVKLKESQEQLNSAKAELSKGEIELEKGKLKGQAELDKAKVQLADSEKSLIDGEKEIDENKAKLTEAKENIKKEEDKLNDIEEGKYYFFDRNDNVGYSGLKDAINSLDSIASVLPVFFFLVAIMICLTTMTRMVEENRGEIGTLKALGYNNFEISRKFVVYASLASIIGSVLGILIGCTILPNVINESYKSLYNLPRLTVYYYPSYIVQSILISILCTVGAALFVLSVELKSTPSNLMRQKAPKLGKKILLERIKPLWSRLNFNQKVTFRNIFRYKQRMIMTVLGISGCMAMLITGFALKDSNTVILEKQFDKLWKYDAMVIFDDTYNKEENKEYNNTLNNLKGYESKLNIHQESVTFSKEGMNKQSVSLYVPESTDRFDNFIVLNNRKSREKYKISDDGVIISEKLANLLGTSAGDTITMKDENNDLLDVKVSNISENYLSHYMYMSPSYYKEIFGKDAEYNSQFLNFNKGIDKEEVSNKLMDCENVINVTLMSDIKASSEESSANLNMVMLVIIISAGSLAFVVLYNLNNINVSERIRELSTIKVLGFYDNEVTMYILRENVILTLFGILAGSFLGKILHAFILYTSETDTMMMYPDIFINSYVFSALITMLFSMIVMIMMHNKLKKVDMIDALKSNE